MKSGTKKIISGLLIVAIILPSVLFSIPKEAFATPSGVIVDNQTHEAQTTLDKIFNWEDLGVHIKEWALQTLQIAVSAIIIRLLQEMTNSIVTWINEGFHGSPLFLENPGSFFKDIAKSQIQTTIDQIGYDLTRFPFGKAWALNVINAYKGTMERNAAHSLSGVMSRQQITAYMDFNVGGWNSFFLETQYPRQNSYIGSQIYMTESLSAKLAGTVKAPAEEVQDLLKQGMGFLSPQMCMDENSSYNENVNPWNPGSFHCSVPECESPLANYPECKEQREAACAQEKAAWDAEHYCKNLANVTPGYVVADRLTSSLSSSENVKEYAAVIGTFKASIAAVIDTLINKLMSEGLNALTGAISGESPSDNWSYNGATLDSDDNPSDGGGAGPLNIPQNVSVRVGETTSIEITGGKPEYSIKATDPATPDPLIALAGLSGTTGATLSITGVSQGETSVTIKDSRENNPRKVTIIITVVGEGGLMVIPANIVVEKNDSASATISGGNGDYNIIVSPNGTIAEVDLVDNILLVTGKGNGETSLTIADSSSPQGTATVGITVGSSVVLGTCLLPSGTITQNTREDECSSLGGTWTANNSQAGNPTVSITASPVTLYHAGQSSTLSWTSAETISCSAYWTSSHDTSGSQAVNPTYTQTYSITCYGANGTSTDDSITINIEDML